MKNLFKCLSAFAIASTLGLQVINVNAADTCGAGEVEHTNYYMFLDENYASYYETEIENQEEGHSLQHWNGAFKYNNVQENDVLTSGSVNIYEELGVYETSHNAKINWSIADFWQKYYLARINADGNLEYRDGDSSYLLHNKWWSYDVNWTNGVERGTNSTGASSELLTYIQGNFDNIGRSDLATKGTSLPRTTFNPPASIFSKSTENQLMWQVDRVFSEDDILEGFQEIVYSPAVYYLVFCEKVSESEKYVQYDANAGSDTVVGIPDTQTFTTEVKLSTKTPTRNGYKFMGWAKAADASTADYQPGDKYTGDTVKLYAVWTKLGDTFTITYDANGGKDAPAKQSGETGTCTKVSSSKPTLAGNNFLGWSTDKDAKEADKNYAAGTCYNGENGSITLYAVWQLQTGVSAHVIAFGIVAVLASVILVVAKKKNLFRQI